MASLLPSGGGGGSVKVDAPWRMSRNGQSTSGCAFATGCGALSDLPEKNSATRSLNDDEPAGAAALWGTAGAEAAAVAGVPILPLPLQPAASSSAVTSAAMRAQAAGFIGC